MANKKISELTEASLITGTDVFPVVDGGITKKVKIDTLKSFINSDTTLNRLSANWQGTYTNFSEQSANNISVYSTVRTNSAVNWNYQGSDLKALSANWQNTYTDFNAQSANNISVHSTVHTNSAVNWNYQGTDLKTLSANWQNTFSNVRANSAVVWNYQGTDLKDLSANWQNTFSTVQANSAAYLSSVDLSFLSVSANWNSVYSNVQANSAVNWNYQGSDLKALSANWQNSFSTVQSNSAVVWNYQGSDLKALSANWQNTFSTVRANSAAYLSSVDLSFLSVSANWNSVYSTVQANSASNWNYQGTDLKDLSANWQNTYTDFNAQSATYATISYTDSKFFTASGGVITGDTRVNGNLTVFGDVSSTGTQTFANTIFVTTSALSVVNIGEGPALIVSQQGSGDIASFYDSDQNIEILHIGGVNSSFPHVGVNVSDPNKDFTVKGEISASGTIWDSNGNSDQWNSGYSSVASNSAYWSDHADGELRSLSANWQDTYTAFSIQSANNDSVYSSVASGSANWEEAYTNLVSNSAAYLSSVDLSFLSVSANWENTFTIVRNNSADWNYQGTDLKDLSANWEEAYTNLVSNSAAYLSSTDISFLSVSANWEEAYTNLVSNSAAYLSSVDLSFLSVSANWDSAYTTVNSNSASWDSVYTYVNSNSSTFGTGGSINGSLYLPLSGGSMTGTLTVSGISNLGEVNATVVNATSGENFGNLNVGGNGNFQGNINTLGEIFALGGLSALNATFADSVSAPVYYGDGSHLTGISISTILSADPNPYLRNALHLSGYKIVDGSNDGNQLDLSSGVNLNALRDNEVRLNVGASGSIDKYWKFANYGNGFIEVPTNSSIIGGNYGGSQVVFGDELVIQQIRNWGVHIKTGANGDVYNTWTFDTNGTLTIPATGKIVTTEGNSNQWNSSYSTYSSNSASYATVSYADSKFFPLSGGLITGATRINGDLTIFGNISSTGTQTFANTVFTTTSALSIVNVGTGPALIVGQNGSGDIASFYDLDQNIEILHVGGQNSSFPNVGVKVSNPNKDFTVKGEISASGVIWDSIGNSNQWNSTYTTVGANSATAWNYQGTDLKALSSNWQNAYTTVNSFSGGWSASGLYLPLSGGTISDGLTANSGTFTSYLSSPALSGTHYGDGSKLTGVSRSTDVQTFALTGTYTWTKPAGAKSVNVTCIGGGGGGASGRRSASGTAAYGGGGGAGGGYSNRTLDAALLSATETVVVGAGGAGAAAQTVDNTDGRNGGVGGISSFGSWVFAGVGTFAGQGTTAAGLAGSALSERAMIAGGNGGSSSISVAAGTGAGSQAGGAGGGGGGGISTTLSAFNGGVGGIALATYSSGGGAAAGTAPGGTGGDGLGASPNWPLAGGGGAGGAASINSAGGTGGAGGIYGGGGGGGGGSLNGFNSGAGGPGANGIVVVTTYF